MKNKFFHFITLSTAALAFAGCVDTEIDGITASQLDSIANLSYLKEYGSLKDYVNRSENPDFKLGCGVAASSFINSGIEYRVAAANFDEVTAGNAMKYASCVADDGSMDFGTVMDFVSKAKEDGISIYGHTLAWHSQQNIKYLSSLIKDKELDIDPDAKLETLVTSKTYEDGPFPFYAMGCEPPVVNGAIHFVPTGDWSQFFIFPGGENTLAEGDYLARLYMTSDKEATGVQLTIQNGWGGDAQNITVSIPVKEGEQIYELNFPGVVGGNFDVILKPQTADATLDVSKIEFYKLESPAVEMEQDVRVKTYEDGPFPFYAMGCEPPVINGAIHFVPTGDWSQFFCLPGGENNLTEGDYVMYLDLEADKEATGVQFTIQNGWGSDAQQMTASVALKAGRNTYKLSFPGVKGGDYDCILKPQTADATLDLYSVTVKRIVKLNSIPLTPEEKKEVLTEALDKWIEGMMKACEGYVTTWDVVNEAISGADSNGDGIYELQHSEGYNPGGTWDVGGDAFYWQDYLGDIDYVRTAVASARKHFEANGGEPSKLKLFINDYNLESDWDNNAKVKSLVHWIGQWEADGVTKIDGIGTQMHVSCFANETTMQSKKNHIVEMFKILAQSGKLIKISELDMGYVDAAGNSVTTENLSDEQAKQMAEYYKFIVEQYFENIPAGQRYGITQWALTDSPKSGGWRSGEPIGLWTEKWDRKRTFGGFADGLIGK